MKKTSLVLMLLALISLTFSCSSEDNDSNSDENSTPSGLTIVITDITEIKPLSSLVESEVINESDISVIERGIVWSTSPNPTINDNVLIDSNASSVEQFILRPLCLYVETTYYVRAYVKTIDNEIYYSVQNNFTTLPHNVYVGNLLIENDQDIINFNAMGYSKIDGNLDINQLDSQEILEISEVTGYLANNKGSNNMLSCLKIIGGNASFYFVYNFQGLEKLTVIDGDLVISYGLSGFPINNHLNDLDLTSFENLSDIGGNFLFNSEISYPFDNVTGLNSVESIGNSIIDDPNTLDNDKKIEIWAQSVGNLNILNSLVSNDLNFDFRFIKSNININSFNSIEKIKALLFLECETESISIDGFSNLNEMDSFIFRGDNVGSLSGLNNVNKIKNFLSILGNPGSGISSNSLLTLNLFQNLTEVGDFNSNLVFPYSPTWDTNIYPRLVFEIDYRPANYGIAPDIYNSFQNLTTINGDAIIFESSSSGVNLGNLQTVKGNLKYNTQNASSMSGFSSLNTINGFFEFEGQTAYFQNNNLVTLSGFDNLTTVDDYLLLRHNINLTNYCALNTLVSNGFTNIQYPPNSTNGYEPTAAQILNGQCEL